MRAAYLSLLNLEEVGRVIDVPQPVLRRVCALDTGR